MNRHPKSPWEKSLLWGIPFIFAVGTALHYLYELTGKNILAACIAPVNESVWEHTKMVCLPTVFWWGRCYKKHAHSLHRGRWMHGALAALAAAVGSMPAMYYLYTGVLGRHFLAVDISLLALSAAIGQTVGAHVYKHGKECKKPFTAMAVIAGIFAVMVFFTFHPPRLPLFRDGQTGLYGVGRG